jgi:hypothetical protein
VAHVPFFLTLEEEIRNLPLISDHHSSEASSPMKQVPFFERRLAATGSHIHRSDTELLGAKGVGSQA